MTTQGRCQRCQQEVRWYTTRERGTPIAVDPSPDPDEGTVMIATTASEIRRGRPRTVVYVDVLSGDALSRAQADNEHLFMVHARTCPSLKPFNPRPAHITLDLPKKH
ncbi:MAG: hypothetical protein WBF79_15110 [Rhodococcus sp. (in: high G+C Gram-positive bacteria)]